MQFWVNAIHSCCSLQNKTDQEMLLLDLISIRAWIDIADMGNNCILSKKTRFVSWQRINVTNHHIICLFLDELIFFWFLAKKGYTPHSPNIGINFSWNIQVLDVVIIPRPFRILEDRFKKHEFSCCHPENTGSNIKDHTFGNWSGWLKLIQKFFIYLSHAI